MENFPIQDLLIFEKEYAELKESYASLEEIFNEVIEEMDLCRYYEDQCAYEGYLQRFIDLEKDMKAFKNKLDKLKNQLLN